MNIQNLVETIKDTVESHRLETEGEYARYLWQNAENSRKMGLNEYGCADAINILYTINEFPRDLSVREKHVKALQSLQDPETGLFREDTHHFIHTTAHCIAALELFDAFPLYKLKALEKYKAPENLIGLLEGLDWENNPWSQSHQGAGIYASMKLNEETDEEWEKTYFDWMWENADPELGFWKKGIIGDHREKLYEYLAAGFHYMFNHQYAKMPLRYPEKIIDTCLELYDNDRMSSNFGQNIGFLEIDWIYCVTRSLRQCGYRHEDCMAAIRKFAKEYIDWMSSIDHKTHDGFNDLHALFGACCALAELQTALPGEITTRKPLRLVLDRRPFI